MPKESIVFLGGILLSSVLIPIALPLYRKFGFIDRPNARSNHTSAIPRGMGLVVVLAFIVVLGLYSLMVPSLPLVRRGQMEALFWAVTLLVGVGFFDDTKGVPAWVKLLFQCGSAVIVIAAGIVMPLPVDFGNYQVIVEKAVTLLWIVGVINAINFIDGSDGLATTLCALCMILFVGISRILPADVAKGCIPTVKAINLLGLAGAGCALPFLLYNLAPAKCFLGDSGSTFFGLLLAVLGVLFTQCPAQAAAQGVDVSLSLSYLVVPCLVLFVPIVDAVRVTAARMLRSRSPFRPDNRHLHHVLHRAGLSANQVLFIIGLTVLVSGLGAAIVVRSSESPYILWGVVVLLVYGSVWFCKSSYQARRFITLALSRRLLQSGDALEGYENAAAFKNRFEQEISRARRHQGSVSVVLVNAHPQDGSAWGGLPLENPKFLENLLKCLRREDVKCRYASDRLAFLLVETDKELGAAVCARLREHFDSIRHGEPSELDVRIGIASYPDDGDSVAVLLEAVEAAAVSKPAMPEPVLREPVIREPVIREPALREPVIREPVVISPAVSAPAAAASGIAASQEGQRAPGVEAALPVGAAVEADLSAGAAQAPGEADEERRRWEAPLAEKDALLTRVGSGAAAKRWFAK